MKKIYLVIEIDGGKYTAKIIEKTKRAPKRASNITAAAREKGLRKRQAEAITGNSEAREIAATMRAAGNTWDAIAWHFNQAGIYTRYGRPWSQVTVARLVK